MAKEGQTEAPAGERVDWKDRHLWEIQPVRDVLVGLSLIGLLWLGARLSLLTVPLLLALLIAYLLEPMTRRLAAARWMNRHGAALTLVLGGVLLLGVPVVAGGVFGVVQGVRLVGGMAAKAGAVVASVRAPDDDALREAVGGGRWLAVRDRVVELKKDGGRPPGTTSEEDSEALRLLGIDRRDVTEATDYLVDWVEANASRIGKGALVTGTTALGTAIDTIGSLGRAAFMVFLTAFFAFFLAVNWPAVPVVVKGVLPARNRERTLEIAGRMDQAVAGFVRGRLIIAAILAVFYSVGFAFIGVPAPLLIGMIIAVLALIPYAVVGAIPVVIVLLWLEPAEGFRDAWWWIIFAPIVLYQLGQTLDDYVLTPTIQGKATDLATPSIVFASIAGGLLAGIYGLLIAIPVAACAKILWKELVWPRVQEWSEGKRADFLPIDGGGEQ